MRFICAETAAASAITGEITDPRTLDMDYPVFNEPKRVLINANMVVPPPSPDEGIVYELQKGPNIKSLPAFDDFPDRLEIPVLLKVGDDISTDEIMPAGQRVLPYRSNIEKMSEYVFADVDNGFYLRARQTAEPGFAIIAGKNYGQGSSREHAALVPRFLGLRVVIARSFARIHRQNLINFGILPLLAEEDEKIEKVGVDDRLVLSNLHDYLNNGEFLDVVVTDKGITLTCRHDLTEREKKILLIGGLLNSIRQRQD